MVTLNIHTADVRTFLSIFLRISLVFFMTPIFASSSIPRIIKAGGAVSLAMILFLLLRSTVAPLPFELAPLLAATIGEVIFGAVVSLSILFVFAAFQFAGELLSFQMGFGMAQVVDPQSGTQITVFSSWLQVVSTLIFFSMDGHHFLLRAIVESFRSIPIGGFVLNEATFGRMVYLSGQMFVTGIKIAAPVMMVLFLTQVGLALVSKFAPEINVMVVSFPLTILLGLFFLGLSAPSWGNAMVHYLTGLFQVLRVLAGPAP